jgi:hypothetical protein
VDVDLPGGDWLDDNRSNWDERVPVHVASDFYDREPLRHGEGVLDPIASASGAAALLRSGRIGAAPLRAAGRR